MSRRFAPLLLAALLTVTLASPAAAGGATIDRVENFGSVLAVAFGEDFPIASLMRTDCDFAVWIQLPDGTARETMVCQLSPEPVMIPEFQGVPPDRAVIYGGGACVWASDYSWNTSGEELYAASFRVVVTPAGRVTAWSTYPAEPLDCG